MKLRFANDISGYTHRLREVWRGTHERGQFPDWFKLEIDVKDELNAEWYKTTTPSNFAAYYEEIK